MEVCCGGIIGMGETLEQRAEFAAQLAELEPDEVPMNFLNPRPGTPFADLPVLDGKDALRTIAAFRLAMPRTILRFAGGRELTLGDLGARQGMLGGINAVIVGNYLTTLGRPAESDLELLAELKMPIKALSATLWQSVMSAAYCGQCGRAGQLATTQQLPGRGRRWSRPGTARTAPAGWWCRSTRSAGAPRCSRHGELRG